MPTLPLDDADLHYDVAGEGPPLVLLHGGWLNGDAWQPQVEEFADEYRVVTVDFRGHGQTGPSDNGKYSIGLFADDLEALLAHLEIERPMLCGISLGGMVVQEFLARHPDTARGAVVAGPVQSMPPVDFPSDIKPFVSPLPMLASTLSVAGSAATFQSMLASIRTVNGGPWLSVSPDVRAWANEAVGDVTTAEFRKVFRALYEYEPPNLSHVGTPVLVVTGSQENPLVKQQGRDIASMVRDGSITTVDSAGHLVNQDNPTAFNTVLAEFLATHAASERVASA